MSTHQVCTFHVDDLYFGVDVQEIQEVIRYQELTPVPLAPAAVQGLINLRGQIVTAVDLRRRLGLPDRSGDKPPMNIVVRDEDHAVSLLVDQIGDVVHVGEADFEAPPQTLRGEARELIHGAYKLPQRLLLLLDTKRTVDVST